MLIDVVIPAAGIGKRMGATIPKQYLMLDDATIIEHTINKFTTLPFVNNIVVVLDKDDAFFSKLKYNIKKIVIAQGGKERADSVLNGLAITTTEFVLVHDAARPLVNKEDIIKLVQEASTDDGGILAVKVADTLKEGGANREIVATRPRDNLYRALTPQYFKRQLLINAYQEANKKGLILTDDASAMELSGFSPKLVLGSSLNIKITEPDDLILARMIIKAQGLN